MRRSAVTSRVLLTSGACLETPAERALDRVMRSGHPASVLRLYLSRLPPADLRPYHARVARCLFDDAVQRGGGQVFACRNDDLVLIAGPDTVATLAAVVLRLFRADARADHLLGLWSLPEDEAAVRAEFAHWPEAVPPAPEPPPPLGAIAAIGAVLASAPPDTLLEQHVAVRIEGGQLHPMFREVSVSLPVIEAQIGLAVPQSADPYGFRYIAGMLDGGLVPALAAAMAPSATAVHVNLPVAAHDTHQLDTLVAAARRTRTLLGVEFSLADAIANPAAFRAVRDRLRDDGCTVALNGIDPQTLLLCDLAVLGADLYKLHWSPRLSALPPRDGVRLDRAMDRIGRERVVVHRAETEAAVVWGLARGLTGFQGRHVDLMLAAGRLRHCAHAAGCSLGQCIDRAAAVSEAKRAGCLDPARLAGERGAHDVAAAIAA